MPEPKPISPFQHSDVNIGDVCRLISEPPRVYIVSDVRLYREGLISVLKNQLLVVGAGDSGDFLDQISGLRPHVLILDLGTRDSLSITRRAQQVLPGLRVVAFAVAEVEENVLACAHAGISGYVTQNGSTEDLVAAVLCALKHELVCSPRIAALLWDRLATLCNGRPTQFADAGLTRREQEIAELVARNLANKEIARRLRLGTTTVKNHVHNILQKLNIHRREDVARLQFKGNRWRVDTATQPPERPRSSA
jgi:two-component system, NarL family, nitrate/nitrite response regulator NarL